METTSTDTNTEVQSPEGAASAGTDGDKKEIRYASGWSPSDPRGPRKPDVKERQQQYTKEAWAVRAYLDALDNLPRKQGRGHNDPITTETAKARLERIEAQLADPALGKLERLKLLQRRFNISNVTGNTTFKDLEERFVEFAASYGNRNGISRETWEEMGVPKRVLQEAKIR